ncbi:MAG: bifunctional molybdenum cofactor biosynthesis protein MoaC/MoaB [Bacteroidota bacterium]|nr:bifunctional molybdenum cofactor biosynthesis protein MoaC/MoaB [Bacteroidota bacterium]MDP4232255.1 bifunctional molybdenum cofactor biosynthesis protein MoaC/MoaB [Bacteroidota bacterium]MDP4242657.1 bifunctional molybdenum cofactor biosynthesis protein MoaC/MoaB [Bacteroidota bacterium]MDP4286781.1 bifunctional molybdenum cofactor biosynthesis protein MoaC/MoaB [Bacteroidota bacterium]
MIDTSHKSPTLRTARASALVTMHPDTILTIRDGRVPKGDPLMVARVAATQAAKNTQLIIPYCHPLPLDYVGIEFTVLEDSIQVQAEVKAVWKTGVEMEAMTAVMVAALTLYDMLKMIDEDLAIHNVRLDFKSGGKSDFKEQFSPPLRAAVLVLSDTVSAGSKRDTAGEAIAGSLRSKGIHVEDITVLPDETLSIAQKLRSYADGLGLDIVLTTGGTGLGPRDVTPEATRQIIDREIPGLAELMRSYGSERTPHAALSRAIVGQRGRTVIVNLPGSERGAIESLAAVLPALLHACTVIRGGDHIEATSRSIAEAR